MKLSFVAAISIILFVKTTFENPLINVGTSEVNISMINQWSFNYFSYRRTRIVAHVDGFTIVTETETLSLGPTSQKMFCKFFKRDFLIF